MGRETISASSKLRSFELLGKATSDGPAPDSSDQRRLGRPPSSWSSSEEADGGGDCDGDDGAGWAIDHETLSDGA